MKSFKHRAITAFLAGIIAVASPAARAQISDAPADVAGLGTSFRSATIDVDGARIHYVIGGGGPPILLIHGFPQDWTEYKSIMPRLARQFTVVSIDLRGVGESSALNAKFDAATMAADLHQLVTKLGLKNPYIVGHDIGGMVAYAYALQHCGDIGGTMIAEVTLPGIKGTDALDASPFLWHIRFMQTPGVAEKLIAGRHDVFPGIFLDYGKFSPERRRLSLLAYSRDDQMEAMLQIYRAFPANAAFNASHRCESHVPIVFVTAEGSPFGTLAPATVDGMKRAGFANARATTVSGGMHFLFADIPEVMADLIEREAGHR